MKSPNLLRTNKITIATEYLLNDYNFFSTPDQMQNLGNFYVYDTANGVYVLDAELFIVDKLNELFPNTFKHYSHIRDVIDQIQQQSPIISTDQVDPPNITNYKNGLFLHKENKLIPHSPRYCTTKQIRQKYIQQEESSSLSLLAQKLALA